MYRILTASKDTYITNKIIDNNFHATDANVGQAGTLDLFKLYAESSTGSNTTPTELSRLLIKFPISEVKYMHDNGKIDVGDSSFKSYIKLHDVYGGQTTPNKFNVILFPLSKSFDEGSGYDVINYADIDSTNYITASFAITNTEKAAHAILTVADGDDDTAAELPAEKTTIKIISTDGTSKTYVIVDDNATTVATGDVLASDSDTGSSTAGDTLVGGIAVAINLTGTESTQANVLNQLRLAIINSNGHNGKITVSSALTPTNGSQSITLTQETSGYDGNRIITNNLVKVTSTEFTGGVGGAIRWHQPGAMRSGTLGDPNIDVITSGTIFSLDGKINLSPWQYFESGEEDLNIDVTTIVSASAKGLIPDNGFLIALSGSHEKDKKSYFVKRFASRNSSNRAIRPKLTVQYDDTLSDNHENFEFDITGSLFLNNFKRGSLSNIVSGSEGTALTGENCMILKVESGSFSKKFNVSQVLRGTSTKATTLITITGNPTTNRSIVLEDIENNISGTFTFASDSTQTIANVIGYQGVAGNNTSIAGILATSVNTRFNRADPHGLGISATDNEDGTVTLTQEFAGLLGNTTIDNVGVSNITISNSSAFSGGTYEGLTGIYKASLAVSSFDTNLYDLVLASGSVTFNEIWSNHKETATYLSSSLTIKRSSRTSVNFKEQRLLVSMLNLRMRYKNDEFVRLRVFAENADREVVFKKTPFEKKSEIFTNMFYRVRDANSGDIIIPFDDKYNSTKLSADSLGMYFDFYMSSLSIGRPYVFDFKIKQAGFDQVIKDAASKFIIE